MCGIIIVVGYTGQRADLNKKLQIAANKIRHRGPDWSGSHMYECFAGCLVGFAHERLAIVDPGGKGQPLYSKNQDHILCVNGEIYTHEVLKKKIRPIIPIYDEK